MAHLQQFRFVSFVKDMLPDFFHGSKVLEVGSLNINGSVRSFFENCDYVGLDVDAGDGVDVVSNGEDYGARASLFDVVISCECMEHNPMYEKTWLNMLRVMRDDGLIIMTCATFGRKQHGTTLNEPISSPLTIGLGQDYYKNLIPSDFELVNLDKVFLNYFFVTDHSSHDLYFLGVGKGVTVEVAEKFSIIKSTCLNFYEKIGRDGLA
jgi:hypothetical protein